MSASHKARIEAARKASDKIIAAIYKLAPNDETRFSECLNLASGPLRAKYDQAQTRLINIECDAVSAGKAWRASPFGQLVFYK